MDDKKSKNKKKNNWKEWEKIAYEYVRAIYKDAKIQEEKHTDASHDSGFDGIWLLRSDDKVLMKLVLMEAKYRTSQSSLPLNDCAKAIIIAFNLSASQLYVVTNIPFAPQTKENTVKFQKRASLEIICVNGDDLKKFIQEKKEYLIKQCKISAHFIKKIEESIVSETNPETFLEPNNLNVDYVDVPERTEQIGKITKGLAFQSAIYLISGNAGTGKSVLCGKVRKALGEFNFESCIIDLSLCTSSRILYLSVLESIWGVDLEPVLEDSNLEKYIDTLLSVEDSHVAPEIINSVKYILLSKYSKYQKHKDIYLHLLLKYLDLILNSKRELLKIVIFFENIHMASEETFVFLTDIIHNLKKNNIRIVLETRTPFFMPKLNQIEKSKSHFQHIKNLVDSEFKIAQFQRENSIEVIKKHFKLTNRVCGSLADILCDNPLEIHNAVKLLEDLPMEFEEYINTLSNEQLKKYWEKLGIKFSATTMSLLNNLKNTPYFSQIFELSVILKGRISSEIIVLFFSEDCDNVIKKCINSTIFDLENGKLICRHLRYLDAMKEMLDENLRYQTAKKLLPYVLEHEQTDEYYLLIELDILYIIGDVKNIPDRTLCITRLLMRMHQYQDAFTELFRYIKTERKNSKISLEILLSALDCIRELHEENNVDYEFIYNLVEKNIILEYVDFEKSRYWYKYQLMLWHKNFVIGNLQQALKISKELYDSLANATTLFEDEEDYPGQVYDAYGLSIKMCSSGDDAYVIFQEGVNRYPCSHHAWAALLSQEGNQLLKRNPDEAVEKYKKLIETVEGKWYPYQEVLHTKTDIAMSFFLSGKFQQSILWAQRSIEEASALNMYSQKGRAENIYGCCLAAQMKYETSIEKFRESIYLLEISKSELYLWRAQLNLASILLLQSENNKKAKQLLFKVLNMLKSMFAEKINKDKQSVPYYGLLLVLRYLYDLEEFQIINDVELCFSDTDLAIDFSRLLAVKDWRSQFKTKVICYSGTVLVTG